MVKHLQRRITTFNRLVVPLANSERPLTIRFEQKTHIFNANLQKQLLSNFDQNFKIKAQEHSKFVADKKVSITIIFGQCNKATKTKIALRATYNANRQARNFIGILKTVRTVYFGSDNG